MTSKQDLISKIKQLDGISQDERAYLINLVNTKKKYGLVWEDKPEDVEEQLRDNLPVLREVVEKRISPPTPEGGAGYTEAKANDLFPDFALAPPLGVGGLAPNHILIEGDNLHALTALTFTHEGKIDVIYIDPPYNTGNKDFKYNDTFVDKEDSYRHSKWLSFMDKRLRIAKRLLSDTGVVFMSIDDNEQAQLKMLCDEVFGEKNFIAELVWKKKQGGGNDSKHFVVEHEYVLSYSKNKENILINIDKNYELDNALYPFKDENDIEYGLVTLDKSSIRFSQSLVFEIKDNDGNLYSPRIVKGKQSCWRWGQKKVTEEFDKLVFKNGKVYTKYYRPEGVVAKSILYEPRYGRTESGKDAIKDVLGNNSTFSYPKPLELINHILKIGSQSGATILDFFAGSGTTLHATMQLNAEDGGNRQCILVTNNENNICEEVTYERNKRVIQGYTNAKGVAVAGLENNNLRYYKSEFVSRDQSLKNKRELTKLATELLCIKEDCYNEVTANYVFKNNWTTIYANAKTQFIIIYDDLMIEESIAIIKKIKAEKSNDNPIKVYVFSNGQYPYTEDFEEVLDCVTLCALPDAIYKAYQNVLPKKKRDIVPVLEEDLVDVDGNLFNQENA
ncbi:site-specific DNA-methyltransferase [Flavobacterium sp. RSP46]|uniref:site-specific DNA-methyltransferase n=1 Tax=Flavobacterium sp. RSP46 TaxID=2497486 RepID=UPI000F891031|nr:site-specific DNA-methyltransferase [Flavobacterium sp. RSP46]RTY92036.1 site-specific DNA-methyltransferase [Flavobacterium sp. RSP46]